MTSSATRTPDDLALYLGRMRTFHEDLTRAMDDLAFADGGGSIDYLFDTNVVALYLNPSGTLHAVSVLPPADDDGHKILVELAAITAELLFSRNLPGQNGNAPLVTVDHGVEIARMSTAISKKLRMNGAEIGELRAEHVKGAFGKVYESIKQIEELTSRGGSKAHLSQELLREARQRFRKFLTPVTSVTMKEGARLAHIFKSGLLSNVEAAQDFELQMLAPPRAQLAQWCQSIESVKLERKRQRQDENDPDADAISADKITADARSIMQVELLNAAARQSNRRYVFVTCDEGLAEAYRRQFERNNECDDENDKSETSFYALRHPRQYLQLADLPNTDEAKDKRTLVEVIDGLLDGFGGAKLGVAGRSSQRQLQSRAGEHLQGRFEELTEDWYRLCDTAVRGEFDKLAAHIATELRLYVAAFKAEDILEGLAETISTILLQVERLHLAIGAIGSVLGYVLDAREWKKRGARAPIAISNAQLNRFIGTKEINGYLTDLVSPNSDDVQNLQSRLTDTLDTQDAYLPPFLAACICLRTMQWDAALTFVRGALKMLDPLPKSQVSRGSDLSSARYELEYLGAVARRFRVHGEREFGIGRDRLKNCLAYHRRENEPVQEARALSELAALDLMQLVASQLIPIQPGADPKRDGFKKKSAPEQREMLQHILQDLSEAQVLLDSHDDRRRQPFYLAIQQQIVVNQAQATIFNVVLASETFSGLPNQHPTQLEQVLLELEGIRNRCLKGKDNEETPDEVPPVVEVNFHMLSWLVSRDGEGEYAKVSAALSKLDEFSREGNNLAALDKEEIAAYRGTLEARISKIHP